MLDKLKETAKYILPFTLAVFIYALVTDFDETTGVLRSVWQGFSFLVGRFMIGFGMAYMLNFFVEWLRRVFRLKKIPAIALTYLFFIGILAFMIVYIIPMMVESVQQILEVLKQVPQYPENVVTWITATFPDLGEELLTGIRNLVKQTGKDISEVLQGFLTFTNVSSFLSNFARSFYNITFGFIISIYVLVEKPVLARRAKGLVYALFSNRRAGHIIEVTRESNRVFSSFLVGKTIDSLIIGLMSLPIYYIFSLPQAPFLALIAGVTNMVPYFGPLAGGIVTAIILLFLDPVKAVYAIGIVIVMQTFDGWVLGPRILGNAVGISPLLTIVAITVGGDLFGFMGIFLGVPAMAVLKTMVFERLIKRRLVRKKQAQEAMAGGEPPPEIVEALETYDPLPLEDVQEPPRAPKQHKNFRKTNKKK